MSWHYNGFHIKMDCGDYMAIDMHNRRYFLNGRENRMEHQSERKGTHFRYVTLESAKKAIDRYEKSNPEDPIFDAKGKYRNT